MRTQVLSRITFGLASVFITQLILAGPHWPFLHVDLKTRLAILAAVFGLAHAWGPLENLDCVLTRRALAVLDRWRLALRGAEDRDS